MQFLDSFLNAPVVIKFLNVAALQNKCFTILVFKSVVLFTVPSLLVNVHGLELQLGTAKEVSGGYHHHQNTVQHGLMDRSSLIHSVTSKKVE